MRRALIGIALGFGLLVGDSASAIVITSGEAALLGHGGPPPQTIRLESNGWSSQPLSLSGTQLLSVDRFPFDRFGQRSFDWTGATHWRTPARLREIAARLFPRALPRHREFPLLDGPLFHPRLPARLIDPIPEPGTGLLFGAGLLWLGLARRARR
jgi:hypothetical protein